MVNAKKPEEPKTAFAATNQVRSVIRLVCRKELQMFIKPVIRNAITAKLTNDTSGPTRNCEYRPSMVLWTVSATAISGISSTIVAPVLNAGIQAGNGELFG